MVFLPDDREQRAELRADLGEHRDRGAAGARMAQDADQQSRPSARRRSCASRSCGRCSSGAPKHHGRHGVRAQAVRDPQAKNAIRYTGMVGGDYFYVAEPVASDGDLQGHAARRTLVDVLSRPVRSADGIGDCAGAFALQHEHVSELGRAHPYRYLIHNGEINTLRGNENWMHARQAMLASKLFGDDLPKVFPIIQEDGSDSAKFDNCLEFLALSGRSLAARDDDDDPRAVGKSREHGREKAGVYEYHSSLMEPWDGPASIAFTDGTVVGAVLDRNGLRPSRYYVTKDDLVIMASEVGVLDVPPERCWKSAACNPAVCFW